MLNPLGWDALSLAGERLSPPENPERASRRRLPMTRTHVVVLAFHLCTAAAIAQCTNPWLPGDGAPGANAQVDVATTWDPDGAGPAHELVVVGGSFGVIANVLARGVAAWDPQTGQWSAFGDGLEGVVSGLAGDANGRLFAVGWLPVANGGFVARWDGATWTTIAATQQSSSGNTVGTVACLPNGDIVVGGGFAFIGGVPATNVARWNGTAWSAMGTGSQGAVYSVAALANGDVVATGGYPNPGSVSSIGRWNGSSWQPVGIAPLGAYVVREMANGDLVAGGYSGGDGRVARWNGTVWSTLGTGIDAAVRTIAELPNGDLLVGGDFETAGASAAGRVARWNGSTWSPLGSGANNQVRSVAVASTGMAVVGGVFSAVGGVVAANLALWDGAAWSAVGPGANRAVNVLKRLPNGDLLAGGAFTRIGTVAASRIARRSGGTWHAFGAGTNGAVYDAVTMPNGDLVIAGDFTTAGGVAAPYVARWNGAAWSPLGTGPDYHCRALTLAANGDLIVGGNFQLAGGAQAKFVARWNGATWSPLGAGTNHVVHALATLPGGDIVAGGLFWLAGGAAANGVARWDGAAWHPLGQGVTGTVYALAVAPDGALVAGGTFANAGGMLANNVARWHNGAWSTFGTGLTGTAPEVQALAFAPNGDVFAAGRFAPAGIARWRGVAWESIDPGFTYLLPLQPTVPASGAYTMVMLPEGTLEVGGAFLGAGNAGTPYLARLGTTCPAGATSYGAGCASSGGMMILSADSLPWRGSTFRATATGLPASSFALAVWGFTQVAVPLPAILPEGGAGCTLLASFDWSDALLPTAGACATQLAIPNSQSLAALVVNHQVAAIEIGAAGIVAVTTTNGLELTVGRF